MVSEKGEDACLTVLPKLGTEETGMMRLPLEMSVPPEFTAKGGKQTEDIVKIIVTSHSSTFPGTILSRLGSPNVRNGPDELARLLEGLNTNTQRIGDKRKWEWANQSYLIRTCL